MFVLFWGEMKNLKLFLNGGGPHLDEVWFWLEIINRLSSVTLSCYGIDALLPGVLPRLHPESANTQE